MLKINFSPIPFATPESLHRSSPAIAPSWRSPESAKNEYTRVVHGQLTGQQVAVDLKKPFGHFFKIMSIFFQNSGHFFII